MAVELTVGEAIRNYIAASKPVDRPTSAPELQRFSRWFGPERSLRELSPIQLERYQEMMLASGVDPTNRLEPLRQFLSDARTKKLIDVALAGHVRVRRKTAAEKARSERPAELETIEVTQAGYDQLRSDLKRLELEDRPVVTAQVASARADGDLRENAPYHAARESLQDIDRKINEIKSTLSAAVIVGRATGERAGLGTTLVVRDLNEDEELTYTLVGPGEVDRRNGKISIQSPVGRAFVDRAAGETVEVSVPEGTHRYRIERIDSSR